LNNKEESVNRDIKRSKLNGQEKKLKPIDSLKSKRDSGTRRNAYLLNSRLLSWKGRGLLLKLLSEEDSS